MNNLTMGGAENSLVSLLQVIDYNAFDVDLLLFKKEGFFLNSVPSQVTLLGPVEEFSYFDMPIRKAIFKALLRFRWDIIYARIAFLFLKSEKNSAVKEQKSWKYLSVCIPKLKGNYDVAIGFLEKTPNYYCVDKTNAQKKIGFIRTDYKTMGMDETIDLKYFDQLDYIFCNSEKTEETLIQIFPQFSFKIKTIQNFFSVQTIHDLSNQSVALPEAELSVVSMGRLVSLKGFDLAIEACKIIKEKGIPIKWILIGDGPERMMLQNLVDTYNLGDSFFILGEKENPFPYVKWADFYVHTSKYEGKSRAVEEAKILHKIIISTRYPSILEQIENGVTGFVVDFSAEALAEKIVEIQNNATLQHKIIANLQNEKIDNEKELQKLTAYIH